MSFEIRKGRDTTEYERFLRMERAAAIVTLLGLGLAIYGAFSRNWLAAATGAVLCLTVAYLLASTFGAYARSRSDVKAAAYRKPVDSAPATIQTAKRA
jgi:hypothetical protein